MCKLKSAILLKDRVFIPDYDSHSDMLGELNIEDTRKNAETLFVRAELYPEDGDVFSPIEKWKYRVDQDVLPEWYVAGYDEQRMRDAVKEWAKERIHVGKDGLIINSGSNHYIKDCKNVKVCGNASVRKVCGSASISEVCDSASISYVYGSASISEVYGSASISYVYGSASISEVCDSASISYVYGSASISEVCDSASISKVFDSAVVSSSYGWANKDRLSISENATFRDRENKVIYQAGDWTFEKV